METLKNNLTSFIILVKEIIYILLQFLLFSIFFIDWDFYDFPLYPGLEYLLWGGCFIGFVIIFAGILNLNLAQDAVPKTKFRKFLIRYNIYKHVRHPIYLGILVAMFFYAFYEVSIIKIVSTLFLGIVFYFKTKFEEIELIQLDEKYPDYINETGRFFPRKRKNRNSY